MKISAFTFIRNGVITGFPFIESIRSLLPLADEYVVNVGRSDDDTLERVRALAKEHPKIRIIESIWNERMQQKGFVYAQQKMIAQYSCTGDWAFYLEGDEVLHENDLPAIRVALEKHHADPEIEALAFDYYHFWGSPDQLVLPPTLYQREVRVIRNTIRSYAPDGLYWLVQHKKKGVRYPYAALVNVPIYHYGNARALARMRERGKRVAKYWGGDGGGEPSYSDMDPRAFKPFTQSHPAVMSNWIRNEAQQTFSLKSPHKLKSYQFRNRLARRFETLTGVRFPVVNGHFIRKKR